MNEFGHKRPIRDRQSKTVIGFKPAPARRITRGALGFHHGPDRGRRLVVSLVDGDLVQFRPAGTSRPPIAMTAQDLYDHVLRTQAAAAARKRAQEKRERQAAALARRRQQRAERRLFAQA